MSFDTHHRHDPHFTQRYFAITLDPATSCRKALPDCPATMSEAATPGPSSLRYVYKRVLDHTTEIDMKIILQEKEERGQALQTETDCVVRANLLHHSTTSRQLQFSTLCMALPICIADLVRIVGRDIGGWWRLSDPWLWSDTCMQGTNSSKVRGTGGSTDVPRRV